MTAQTQTEAPKTYDVTLIFDASKSVSVQATSVEEAIYLASDKVGTPSLCHQCSYEIDLGDCTHEIVYLDGEEVEDTDYRVKTISELKERIAQLEAELTEQCKLLGASAEKELALRNKVVGLQQELVSESWRTASERLRADQLTEQHRMQASMNSEARSELAQLRSRPALSDEQIGAAVAVWFDSGDSEIGFVARMRKAVQTAIGEPA